MKKIRFLLMLGIGILGLLLSTGCQKHDEDDIDMKGREVIKLDFLESEKEEGDTPGDYGYHSNEVMKLVLEGKFESPFDVSCGIESFRIKKNLSGDEKLATLQHIIQQNQWLPDTYEVPELAEDQEIKELRKRSIFITDFPFLFKNYASLSGKIGFINLKTEAQGDDLAVLGPINADQESFFYTPSDEDINGIKIKNLNQFVRKNGQRRNSQVTFYSQEENLIKIVRKGDHFDQVKIFHPLGVQTHSLDGRDYNVLCGEKAYASVPHFFLQTGHDYRVEFQPILSGSHIKEVKLIALDTNSGAMKSLTPKVPVHEITSLQQRLRGKTILDAGFEDIDPVGKNNKSLKQLALQLGDKKFTPVPFYYQEFPVTLQSTGKNSISFSLPVGGRYRLFAVDDANMVHTLEFGTTLGKNIASFKNDPERMQLQIVQNQFLTGAGLSGQLDQIFGSENYTFHIKDRYEYKEDRYGGDYNAGSEMELRPVGKTLTINYFILPNKQYTGTLQVLDIDGEKQTYPLDIMIKELGTARISHDLFSQKLNVLPSEGYRSNRIKLGSKNTKELTLYTQTCELKTKADFSQAKRKELLPPRKLKKWETEENDHRNTVAALHFFDCKGKIEEHKIPVENFEYRKRIDREWELPESTKATPYFRISFEKTMQDAKYYMRSPIGLFAKVAPYQELSLWGIRFSDGKAVHQGEIQIFDADGKLLHTTQLTAQGVTFSLKGLTTDYLLIRYQGEQQAETFIVVTLDGRNTLYDQRATSASWLLPKQTKQQQERSQDSQHIKIYGYTDRGMYRPGDTVHFAGFVQDIAQGAGKKNSIQTGFVVVELQRNRNDTSTKKLIITTLDEFGGFEGEFKLNESALGYYQISFFYTLDPNKKSAEDFDGDRKKWEEYKKTHPFSSYWTEFQVQEVQKPTFTTKLKKAIKNNELYLELTPSYYMGELLKDYDLKLSYSITNVDECFDCWRNTPSDFYYNYVTQSHFYQYGSYEKTNITGGKLLFNLGNLAKIGYKGDALQLKISASIKDRLSDETRTMIEYLDLDPEVKIGLNGSVYDWVDDESLSDYTITAKIDTKLSKVKTVEYERYFRPFNFTQETDTEGTYFYAGGSSQKLVQTGTLVPTASFKLPLIFQKYQGGEYFLKLITRDQRGVVNGEVDKHIYYYDSAFDKGFQGDMENNYTLHVNIPREYYDIGSKIPITINPYIKGATALVTVERGNQILEQKLVTLDGKQLFITAKESFYPNVQISVTQFVGEQINSQLGGSGAQKRHEPAFFAGYAEALIQEQLKTLTIKLKTDKTDYQPGEKVKLSIQTLDHRGTPVTARVSLSVVDKALTDLYDLIKEPLPYFFNRMGSSIGNFGNRKNLYYALRTFFADGEKGGGGADGSLKNMRKKFYDLAFWNAAIITTGGKADLEFTLPDNLTTWMLDAIAVSHKTQLGTARAYFKTHQPLLIEANLPTFLTVGDQITLPLKLITTTNALKATTPVTLTGTVKNQRGEVLASFSQQGTVNSKFTLPIHVDESFFDAEYIILEAEVFAGKYHDAVQWKIPIRTEGLVNKIFSLEHEKQGEKLFNFEDEAIKGKLIARLAPFPTAVLAQPFDYLLVRYPNASSETLIRTAQTALYAQKLTEAGLLTGNLVQSGKVRLASDTWMPMTELLENVLQKLESRQGRGGFITQHTPDMNNRWYRSLPHDIRNLQDIPNKELNIAAFGLLEQMREAGYAQLIPKHFADKLTDYLNTLGNATPEHYLFYLAQKKTQPKTINTALVSQLHKKYPRNIAVQTISFLLLAETQSEATLLTQAKHLKTLFEQVFKQGNYFDTKLMDLKALQAQYLRGLLKAQHRFPANTTFSALITEQITSLLKSRSPYGLRSRSASTNFLVLEAINDALQTYYSKQGQATSCTLNLGDRQLRLETASFPVAGQLAFAHQHQLPLIWSCEGSAFLDLEIDYLLRDTTKKKPEFHNVDHLTFQIPSDPTIGKKLALQASFKTQKEAQDLIVEFALPAQLKQLANLDPENSEVMDAIRNPENDRTCYPDHYEFRYDRILLYYTRLRAGKQCRFSFPAINAYQGSFTLPPTKLYESSATEVWATTPVEILK